MQEFSGAESVQANKMQNMQFNVSIYCGHSGPPL